MPNGNRTSSSSFLFLAFRYALRVSSTILSISLVPPMTIALPTSCIMGVIASADPAVANMQFLVCLALGKGASYSMLGGDTVTILSVITMTYLFSQIPATQIVTMIQAP